MTVVAGTVDAGPTVIGGGAAAGPVVVAGTEVWFLEDDTVNHKVDVASLLASTEAARGAGSLWMAGNHLYVEAASGASDHHITTAGGVKLYAKPANGTINLVQLGLTASTTNVQPLLVTAAALATKVIVPYQVAAWPMTSAWTGSNVTVEFEPGARLSFNMTARAMDLTNVKLYGASFTSTYTSALSAGSNLTHDSFMREVRLNSNCVVENYYHEHAAAGLNITAGNNIRISNAKFSNLRHYKGWAPAIHAAGTSSYNIRGSEITITDCDRGVEIESGVRDAWFDNGYQTNVYPNGYSGQPGDYATYTFTIGAHSHLNEGYCSNINYKNWHLENCGGGALFALSSGSQASDMPRNCTAKDIRIVGSALANGYEMIGLQGFNNVVENVILQLGSGITSKMLARFYGGSSESNRLSNVYAENYALPLVQVDNAAVGNVIEKIRPLTASTGTGFLFEIAGAGTMLRDHSLYNVTGTDGYVHFASTADGSRLAGTNYSIHTDEDFTTAFVIDSNAHHVEITGLQGSNFATTPPVDVGINSASYAQVHHNSFDRSNGTCVSAASGSANCIVVDNIATASGAVFQNLGTGNSFDRNGKGTSLALTVEEDFLSTYGRSPGLAATVMAGGSINNVSANQAILCRVVPSRNMTITLLEWIVGTQSGNYDIGIYNSSGARQWAKGSTAVPAGGTAVAETVSPSVTLTKDSVYYVAWNADNTTATLKGTTLASNELTKALPGTAVALSVASAFPLPSSLTVGSTAVARLPLITLREA